MNLSLSVTLPIRTESEANLREHWRTKHARSKQQRHDVFLGLYNFRMQIKGREQYVIRLVRIAPSPQGQALDGDNLERSFKAVRDEVAKTLGIDDGSHRISWLYAQEKGKPNEYAVRIEFTA